MQNILKKLLDGLFLLRIPLLAPVWTVFLLGWITGNANALPGGVFVTHSLLYSTIDAWIILAGFSLTVATTYVVNQIADIESDRINKKLFILPNGCISVPAAWLIAAFCAIAGMVIACHYGKIFIVFFILSLLLGYLYNLPPVSLKNKAIGGILANAFGHGMITYLAGWYSANPDIDLTWQQFLPVLISSLSPTLANGAVYLATTVPDAKGDKSTGKETFCVKYGEKTTAVVSTLLCFFALVSSFFITFNPLVMTIPCALSIVFFVFFAISTKKKLAFRAFKWPVFLLSAAVVLFQPEYGLLIIVVFSGSRAYYRWRFNIEYPTFKSK